MKDLFLIPELPEMAHVILSIDEFINHPHDLDGDNDTDEQDYELYLDWMMTKVVH